MSARIVAPADAAWPMRARTHVKGNTETRVGATGGFTIHAAGVGACLGHALLPSPRPPGAGKSAPEGPLAWVTAP